METFAEEKKNKKKQKTKEKTKRSVVTMNAVLQSRIKGQDCSSCKGLNLRRVQRSEVRDRRSEDAE